MKTAAQIEFPGFKAQNAPDEDPIRLQFECSIKIKDAWTGETYNHKIPGQTDTPRKVAEYLTGAIQHERTIDSIKKFVEGRDGIGAKGPRSTKDKEAA